LCTEEPNVTVNSIKLHCCALDVVPKRTWRTSKYSSQRTSHEISSRLPLCGGALPSSSQRPPPGSTDCQVSAARVYSGSLGDLCGLGTILLNFHCESHSVTAPFVFKKGYNRMSTCEYDMLPSPSLASETSCRSLFPCHRVLFVNQATMLRRCAGHLESPHSVCYTSWTTTAHVKVVTQTQHYCSLLNFACLGRNRTQSRRTLSNPFGRIGAAGQ